MKYPVLACPRQAHFNEFGIHEHSAVGITFLPVAQQMFDRFVSAGQVFADGPPVVPDRADAFTDILAAARIVIKEPEALHLPGVQRRRPRQRAVPFDRCARHPGVTTVAPLRTQGIQLPNKLLFERGIVLRSEK